MNDDENTVLDILNELRVSQVRSLPVYLQDAVPWMHEGDADAALVLRTICSSHLSAGDRLGEAILDRHGEIDQGEFPLFFADWNDLSLEFIWQKITEYQERDLAMIRQCIPLLASDTLAQSLAQELEGETVGHLESLKEVRSTLNSPA